jgi:hypothetical protein
MSMMYCLTKAQSHSLLQPRLCPKITTTATFSECFRTLQASLWQLPVTQLGNHTQAAVFSATLKNLYTT